MLAIFFEIVEAVELFAKKKMTEMSSSLWS